MKGNPFGPWATTPSRLSTANLSTFCVRRLTMLPQPGRCLAALSRRGHYGLLALAMTSLVMPSLRGTIAARQDVVDRKESQTTAQEAAKVDKDQQALKEFSEIYRLAPGQNLKHIPPPRPDGLRLFWDRTNPDAGNKLDKLGGMIFLWREPDRLDNYGTTTGPGYSLRDLPEYLGIPIEQTRIEGDPELLKTVVNGDWVFRSEVLEERMLKSLESILVRILRLRITLTFRQVERDVVVARGRYHYSPLPGRSENQVDLYGKRLPRTATIWPAAPASFRRSSNGSGNGFTGRSSTR